MTRWTEEQYAEHTRRQTVAPGPAIAAKPKRSKFGNVSTAGFDSKREHKRFQELQLLERAGEISQLRTQMEFSLDVCGEHICKYIADFAYTRDGKRVVEDVKSKATATPLYRLKKKLMRAIHGIEIVEVYE